MLEFRCADSGTICPAVVQALTREELYRQVSVHLAREHSVRTPTQTIMNYMTGLARTLPEPVPTGRGKR